MALSPFSEGTAFFPNAARPLALIVLTTVAYELEYALNFVFVAFVDPVTFSICDTARRLAVILTGAVVFNKPLTSTNIQGIVLALGGVISYSFASSPEASKTDPRYKRSS